MHAWNAPEIYFNPPPGPPANAKEWAQIALDDYESFKNSKGENQTWVTTGPLDQNGFESSNMPEQAWRQMAEQLEAVGNGAGYVALKI